MVRLISIFILTLLFFAGCSSAVKPVSTAKRQELQKILSPKFDLKSVPPEREEDFYRILSVFSAAHIEEFGERVKEVRFHSADEVEVFFYDMFMHGGGSTKAVRKDGQWTIAQKSWSL